MRIEDFRLQGDQHTAVTFEPTDNHSAGMQPVFLVIHYTGDDSLGGAVAWLKQPEAKASAHFVIGRDGEVVQMVPINRRAWHAGASRWKKATSPARPFQWVRSARAYWAAKRVLARGVGCANASDGLLRLRRQPITCQRAPAQQRALNLAHRQTEVTRSADYPAPHRSCTA